MIDWKKCTGCGACENICPVSCIKLENGKNGFLYPKVNEEKCIHCNKCEEVCPIQNNRNMPYEMKRVYLFINKDSYDRNISSSGGFVKALADYVLEEKDATTLIATIQPNKYNFKDFMFKVREKNIQVILILENEKVKELKDALMLGIYDIIFDPFDLEDVCNKITNPNPFSKVSKYIKEMIRLENI